MTRNHKLYFGRKMAFTSISGVENKDAFWVMNVLNIDTLNRRVFISFFAFASIQAFENGTTPPLQAEGGEWSKTYTGESYDKLIAKYGGVVAGTALTAWEIASAVKDTPTASGDFESFFATAGDVIKPAE